MKFSKSFRKKKIAAIDSMGMTDKGLTYLKNPSNWFRTIVFLVAVICILFFGSALGALARSSLNAIAYQTVKLVSHSFGDPMKQDLNGNINVLFVGVGGDNHAGGYLADSIIVASFDPESNNVSMISIPRDLYVNYRGEFVHKINSLFLRKYNHSDPSKNLDQELAHRYKMEEAAIALAQKASDITGLEIPYYAIIDFDGFEEIIDMIGGIDVDVPYPIYDTQYPGPNNTYQTFSIKEGPQTLDGETALKYARSRKTTSDFSRSKRQQLIIKAMIKKLSSTKNLTSISTIKNLYAEYEKVVTTNISVRNMVALIDNAYYLPSIHTFGYSAECADYQWRTMQPGCVLYFPSRDDFNGLAAMLPIGATKGNLSFYEYTSYFAFWVAHKSSMLQETATVHIRNAIDSDYARQYVYREGLAGKTASKLRRYGFDVQEVDNDPVDREKTILFVHGTGTYTHTLQALEFFIPNIQVKLSEQESDYDLVLSLGNDYIDQIGNKPFNYYQ